MGPSAIVRFAGGGRRDPGGTGAAERKDLNSGEKEIAALRGCGG